MDCLVACRQVLVEWGFRHGSRWFAGLCDRWSWPVGAGDAQAQTITTQMLIGDAVYARFAHRYTDVDQAIKCFINRDVLAARQFLEAAKKKDPTLPPVDLLLAKMYFSAETRRPDARRWKRRRLETPDDPEPILILADQALQQGRTIEADALYAGHSS